MKRSALVALALSGVAGCFSLPPSTPHYTSYECHFAYEPELDELRWIEVLHGATLPGGDSEYFEAFQQGRKVYPANWLWCFDLDVYQGCAEDEGQCFGPEHRLLAELAERIEIVDGGLYTEGRDRIGAWRRSRIHRVSELVPELNALVREWSAAQFRTLHSPEEQAQLPASQRALDSMRDFLASGGDALKLDSEQVVLELPIPSDVASELQATSEGVDESSLPFASSELHERPDGQWILRVSDAEGWLTTTAPAWAFFLAPTPEETPWTPEQSEAFRASLRRSGLVLAAHPDLETLKSFEPFTGS
jgi:hypothetical protein